MKNSHQVFSCRSRSDFAGLIHVGTVGAVNNLVCTEWTAKWSQIYSKSLVIHLREDNALHFLISFSISLYHLPILIYTNLPSFPLSIEADSGALQQELNLLTALSVTVPNSAPPQAAELICHWTLHAHGTSVRLNGVIKVQRERKNHWIDSRQVEKLQETLVNWIGTFNWPLCHKSKTEGLWWQKYVMCWRTSENKGHTGKQQSGGRQRWEGGRKAKEEGLSCLFSRCLSPLTLWVWCAGLGMLTGVPQSLLSKSLKRGWRGIKVRVNVQGYKGVEQSRALLCHHTVAKLALILKISFSVTSDLCFLHWCCNIIWFLMWSHSLFVSCYIILAYILILHISTIHILAAQGAFRIPDVFVSVSF